MKANGHVCPMVSCSLYVVGILVCLQGCLAAKLGRENEIIKRKPGGRTGPPEALGAFYYKSFSDSPSKEVAFRPTRRGLPSSTSSCTQILKVPVELRQLGSVRPTGIDDYYQKYTEAYGIPVVGSSKVSDRALTRACYVLRFLLADRYDLRLRYYKAYGRVAVIPAGDPLTSLPEYRFLPPEYDLATPGLGATVETPVSSAKEENILCGGNDMSRDDILMRTVAEGIYQLAMREDIPGFETELHRQYNKALGTGWWRRTYSRFSPEAYWGKGVQSFFNVNAYANPPDGRSNRINTRIKLRGYDAGLFQLILNMVPCANNYLQRCNTRGYEHLQVLRSECPIPIWNTEGRSARNFGVASVENERQ